MHKTPADYLKKQNIFIALKFFRKLRFLDYLIILTILLAGVILFKFLNPEERWINAVIVANNIPYYQADSFKVGDWEKDSSGKKIAEITGTRIYGTPQTLVANKDVLLQIKMLARINPRSSEFEYKNKIVKIGTPVEFRFTSGYLSGKIAKIGDTKKSETIEEKVLVVELNDEWPWLADNLVVGRGETDETGQKRLEILSKEVRPAEMTVTTATGQTLVSTNPRKVDITLKLKVLVQKIGDEFIFRQDERVIVGEHLSFDAGETRVKDAWIAKIE